MRFLALSLFAVVGTPWLSPDVHFVIWSRRKDRAGGPAARITRRDLDLEAV
jgi:hypothetical protein